MENVKNYVSLEVKTIRIFHCRHLLEVLFWNAKIAAKQVCGFARAIAHYIQKIHFLPRMIDYQNRMHVIIWEKKRDIFVG